MVTSSWESFRVKSASSCFSFSRWGGSEWVGILREKKNDNKQNVSYSKDTNKDLGVGTLVFSNDANTKSKGHQNKNL